MGTQTNVHTSAIIAALGVTPTQSGFAEFEIRPRLGDLAWAEGTVPSPKGDIPVRVERKGGRLNLDVAIPEGTSGTVFWPDGKTETLKPGKHTLTGSGNQ